MMLLLAVLAQDQVFLTEDQALELLFGKDAVIRRERVALSEDGRRRIERKLECTMPATHTVCVANDRAGKPLGCAMTWEEIGKYKPITFMVGVDPEGRVKAVHVLVYREPVGGGVRNSWRHQFEGKTSEDPIRRDKDIPKLPGATMSCDAVCLGVRKVLAILQAEKKPVKRQRLVMGTLCTIEAYGPESAVEQAFEEIERLDRTLSNYKEESELSRLNRAGEIEASPELAAFIKEALRYAEMTDGAFDPTIEPAVRLWGFFDRRYRVPSAEEIDRVKGVVGYRSLKVEGTKIRMQKGMAIDPGGLGKGYAVERAARRLRVAGVKAAFIDFGRSSMCAIGAPPGEEGWSVEISDSVVLRLKDASLSTSSQHERVFEKDGKEYGHILDPRTCAPVARRGSVTVVHADAGAADALSTALFVLGFDAAKRLGVQAAFVGDTIERTEGFGK